MRRATVCAAAAAVALAGLLSRCLADSPPPSPKLNNSWPLQLEPTAVEILYGVSADDQQWYNVLNQLVKVAKELREETTVAAMLTELGAADKAELRVQPIVRYLVTHPGATGAQYRFGVVALGAGLGCQLVRTVVLHMHFAVRYASRKAPTVAGIRTLMSKVQAATAGYASRLSFFGYGEAVGYLFFVVQKLNEMFVLCDNNNNDLKKQVLVDMLVVVLKEGRRLLEEQCAKTTDEDIVPTVRVPNYDHNIFVNRKLVDNQQLLKMIEGMDEYEFVDFGTTDHGYWNKVLDIKLYEVKPKSDVEDSGDTHV